MTSGEIITVVAIIAAMVCFIVWRLTLPQTVEVAKPLVQIPAERPVEPSAEKGEARPAPTQGPPLVLHPKPIAGPAIPPGQLVLPAPDALPPILITPKTDALPSGVPNKPILPTVVPGTRTTCPVAKRQRVWMDYIKDDGTRNSREFKSRQVTIARLTTGGYTVINVTGYCWLVRAERTFLLEKITRVTSLVGNELTDLQAVFAPNRVPADWTNPE